VIELLLAVCLIDNPATCKNVSLTYSAEALTPMQCMMRAEPEIAKWITEHPGWQTRRFTCRPAGRYASVLIAAPAAYAEDAKPADKGTTKPQQAAEQSYQEEKAQEKALKEGKAWTK
jgi:hypothetical protein